jgi:hypothetical protein
VRSELSELRTLPLVHVDCANGCNADALPSCVGETERPSPAIWSPRSQRGSGFFDDVPRFVFGDLVPHAQRGVSQDANHAVCILG